MLSENSVKKLKEDWMSFEQVSELNSRLELIDNWSAEFVDEENFWSGVKNDIMNFHKKDVEKCIK